MSIVNITWDAINKASGVSFSNGNLTATVPNTFSIVRASKGKTKGKWYWEIKVNSSYFAVGIVDESVPLSVAHLSTSLLVNAFSRWYYSGGPKYPEGTSYGSAFAIGNVIGVALDLDKGTLEFYKNGVSQGVSHTNIKSLSNVYPSITSGSSSDPVTGIINVGGTPFTYPIPSGYKAYADESTYVSLVVSDSIYKYYTSTWNDIGFSVTEQDYWNYGMNDLSLISESAWKELRGEIKISYYTDDTKVESVTIETEVCPYTIYDEFGDTMEVLYYTDDTTKASANLEITANYSPLDEFYDQPMSLVTYTNDASPVSVAVEGIAPSQWIYQTNDIDIRQGLEGVKLYGSASGKGISRVLVSPDKGVSWFTIKGASFTQVNPLDNLNRCDLATYEAYNALDTSIWKAFFLNKETLRVAYFLSENNTEDIAIADKIEIQLAAVSIDTPTIESIQFEISELTLEGRLKDLELINAINMQKLQFKTNALMKSKKYKMHDLVVDTFEENSMNTIESSLTQSTEKEFTTPVAMEEGFYSEVSLEEYKVIKKVGVK